MQQLMRKVFCGLYLYLSILDHSKN